jgi:hypothetical protein
MGDLSRQIDTYVKENGGRRRASQASQSQLSLIGDRYSGRFDLGKMYSFEYFGADEPWYDTSPIIVSLGTSPSGRGVGINLHYIPYDIRVSLLDRIWKSFSSTIEGQINGSNLGKPVNQSPLPGLNWENLNAAYGRRYNLAHCVKQYRLDRIRTMRVIGYENWYVAAANDENRFHGTTISQAQSLYYVL